MVKYMISSATFFYHQVLEGSQEQQQWKDLIMFDNLWDPTDNSKIGNPLPGLGYLFVTLWFLVVALWPSYSYSILTLFINSYVCILGSFNSSGFPHNFLRKVFSVNLPFPVFCLLPCLPILHLKSTLLVSLFPCELLYHCVLCTLLENPSSWPLTRFQSPMSIPNEIVPWNLPNSQINAYEYKVYTETRRT